MTYGHACIPTSFIVSPLDGEYGRAELGGSIGYEKRPKDLGRSHGFGFGGANDRSADCGAGGGADGGRNSKACRLVESAPKKTADSSLVKLDIVEMTRLSKGSLVEFRAWRSRGRMG